MDSHEKIKFEKVAWLPCHAAILNKALGWALKDINSEIVNGVSELWKIQGVGYMVTRLELTEFGPVLVVVAAQGKNTLPVLRLLPAIARAQGAQPGSEAIRIHSKRPGMTRFLQREGYREEPGLGERVFYGRV